MTYTYRVSTININDGSTKYDDFELVFYKCSLYNNSNKYELKTQSISDLKYMIQFKGSQ